LRELGPDKLRALPSEQFQATWLTDDWIGLDTIRQSCGDHGELIVVQAFRPTLKWPNYISISGGIGQLVADGILVKPDGQVDEAPDDLLWEFR